MSETTNKTRGVFALITVKQGDEKRILLSERQDGKGWNLPGGRVEEGESDHDTLIREVREETGLEVEVLKQIGEPLVFGDDAAVAYACTIVGGQLVPTSEAKQHAYVSAEDLRQGYFRVKHKDWSEDGIGMTAGYKDVPLKLVGPEGRLGRMGRMVWDGFSLLEQSIIIIHQPDGFLAQDNDSVSADGCFLVRVIDSRMYAWPRLDPYSPTGKMEPK